MADEHRIFDVPFLYTGRFVKPRCRNWVGITLRDRHPISVRTKAEADVAPVRLRLRHGDSEEKLDLVHDGTAFYKEEAGITERWFERLQAGDYPKGDFNADKILLTGDNDRCRRREEHLGFVNWIPVSPGQMPMREHVECRRYEGDDRDEVLTKLHRIMASRALIGGKLYREVPAPLWRFHYGPSIVPGELVAKRRKEDTTGVLWWPLEAHAEFAAHVNAQSGRPCRVTVTAPASLLKPAAAPDPVAEMLKTLDLLDSGIKRTLPYMGDAALVQFIEMRRLALELKEGGSLETAVSMARVLRIMAECPPAPGAALGVTSFNEEIIRHLDHWEAMLRRHGLLAMQDHENETISALTAA